MPEFDINSFLGQFKGGARSYLFYFRPNIYGSSSKNELGMYLVRSTTAPNANFEEITASWQGFDLKYAGRKTFENFTVSFNSDERGDLFTAFHMWHNKIRDTETSVYLNPALYYKTQILQMLDYNGNPIIEYSLVDAWPSSISGPSLDYAGNDFLQFDVTFTFNYFKMTRVNN